MDSHFRRARLRMRPLAFALAFTGLGLLTALGASSASESHDPYGSSDANATIEQLAREARAQAASSQPESLSDGSESGAQARELFEEAFGVAVAEPETPLVLEPGAEVERYFGANAARIDSPGSRPDVVALSALPLRTEDGARHLRPVDLTLDQIGDSFAPENPLVDVTIPKRLSDGVEVGSSGVAVASAASTDAALTDNKAFYANVTQDTDWVVGPVATGIEFLVQLRSPEAGERHVLDFELPTGAVLLGAPDGGVDVVRDGELIARVLPPAATDAAGRSVPVGYEVSGNDLTVVAPHRDGGFAYPILVDPVVEDWATDGEGHFTNGWFHNPSLDQFGWEFHASPNSRFEGARQGTSVASYGTPPGRGLYVFGPPNLQRLLGDYGHWRWHAPGQTTYITRADFRTI